MNQKLKLSKNYEYTIEGNFDTTTKEKLDQAFEQSKSTGEPIGSTLVKMKLLTKV